MLRYEALMLAVPEITQDETKTIESQIQGVIKNAGGSTLSFERWGKYRLAYPIKRNEYGVYFLVRFEAEEVGALLKELQSLFVMRLNDLVMRNMIISLEGKRSLEYQRPHSLEEAPPKEAGFFRERNDGYNPRSRGSEGEFGEQEAYDNEESN